MDCTPPAISAAVAVTTTSGVCDTNTADTGTFDTCLTADLLQVVVAGSGTVSSTSPALSTGNISGCTASAGTCLQSYSDGATVTLTATSNAASGTISWSGSTPISCASCAAPGSCACTLTLAASIKVNVSTP
jgi:hypothetical protein